MKTCTKCRAIKPESAFGYDRHGVNQLRSQCKGCRRAYSRAYRDENVEHYRDMEKTWRRDNPEYRREYRHRKPYLKIAGVHNKVFLAIRTGKLVRGLNCNRCEYVGPVQAHHADYDKPLEVEWLCAKCHGEEHRLAV